MSGFENYATGSKALLEFARKQIYCRIWRFAWAYQTQLRELKYMQHLIDLMRQGAKGRSYADIQSAIDQLSAEATRKGFYDRLRFPDLDSVITMSKTVLKAMKQETDRSLTLCAIGLKRHALRYGKLPETLAALVPEFLSAVPVDYMDGKPIRYRLNSDGSFTLYSVGEDGKDDGGNTTLLDEKKDTRLLWARKDYVWPAPATPEEVEEYRQNAGRN